MSVALIIASAVIAVLVLFYFFGSQLGMKLFHALSISTIVGVVEAKRKALPDQSLATIYLSIAKERNERLQWLQEGNYLLALTELGCFNQNTPMAPEEFARVSADTEYLIKCALAEKKFPRKNVGRNI